LLARIDTCRHTEYLCYKALCASEDAQAAGVEDLLSYAVIPEYKYKLIQFMRSHPTLAKNYVMPKSQSEWATISVRAMLKDIVGEEPTMIKKVLVKNKFGSGFVYVFRYKEKLNSEQYRYAYVGMFDKDERLIFERQAFANVSDIELPEHITELQWLASLPQQIRMAGRVHISADDVSPYDRNTAGESFRDNLIFGDE
jgi:hypothetical protein